jgi:ABC-2 type transport system permease protein
VNLKTFIFPGVIAMSVMFTGMFSAASIVWDREFGFLREMLVAPVSRTAIVVGKVLGGAVVATFQGVVILVLAGLAGVPYDPVMLALLVVLMFVGAFTITAFGVVLAARIKKMQSFFGIMQMAMMPMMFLSGALFPLSRLPGWLSFLTRINPLTYAVDPLRHEVFAHISANAQLKARFNPGVTWFGWQVPPLVEVALVLVLGVALLGVAIAQFRRTD